MERVREREKENLYVRAPIPRPWPTTNQILITYTDIYLVGYVIENKFLFILIECPTEDKIGA